MCGKSDAARRSMVVLAPPIPVEWSSGVVEARLAEVANAIRANGEVATQPMSTLIDQGAHANDLIDGSNKQIKSLSEMVAIMRAQHASRIGALAAETEPVARDAEAEGVHERPVTCGAP